MILLIIPFVVKFNTNISEATNNQEVEMIVDYSCSLAGDPPIYMASKY